MTTIPLTIIGMVRFFVIKEVNVQEEKTALEKKEKISLRDGLKAVFLNKYILILTVAIFVIVISGGLMNTAAAYYFKYFVGDQSKMSAVGIASAASIVMLVIFVPLSNKFGKDRIMKLGLVLAFLGSIIRCVAGVNVAIMAIGMGLTLFGIMPISVYFPLFLFDIMDYSEWKSGKRVEGMLAIFPIFALKIASGLSISLGSFILGTAGYDGKLTVQTESAMRAINLTYNTLPAVFLGIMTVIMVVFYNIDKELPKIKSELTKRREEADKNE